MASSVNGIGTKYYGKRDKAVDGTYTTTLFFSFFYIPLIPLRSFRVLPVGEPTGGFFWGTQHYQATRTPLNWLQVFNVYVAAIVIVFGIIVAIIVFRYLTDWSFRDQINRDWFAYRCPWC